MKLPSKLEPSAVTVIIDSREKLPWDVSPLQSERGTLTTGDYSVRGLENVISIERKSLDDLVGCVGRDRDRFEREIQRLLAFPTRAIIVEGTWHDVAEGSWRAQVSPKQVEASICSWIGRGIPVLLSGDHQTAGRHAARILFLAARQRYREARALIEAADNIESVEAA